MEANISSEKIISDIVRVFPEPAKSKLADSLHKMFVFIYENKSKEYKGLFEPLEFFTLIVKLFEVSWKNKMKPTAIKECWESFNLQPQQLHLLLKQLHFFLAEEGKADKDLAFCRIYIETEVDKLQEELDKTGKNIEVKTIFKLSTKKGAKTDLIRILNALYELRLIQQTDGDYPTKETFMKKTGDFFGVDLTKYDVNLSQTFEGSLETNLKVFEEMKKKYTDEWTKRNK
jgi:hypothetical protein